MNLRSGFRIGEWKVTPLQGEISCATESRRVQPKAMDVLVQLVKNAPHVVSRDELLDAVWDARPGSDESLTRCIGDLRRAFDDGSDERQYLETIPKRGYRLLYWPEPIDGPEEERLTDSPTQSKIPYRSLAIMPFRFLGRDPDMEYLGEGLAEELITSLASYATISVAARTSSFSLRNADHNEVRNKLGVRYVLEGSIAREGDRIRLNIQLVNTKSGYQRFARIIETEGSSLFTLQDRLRIEVLRSLPVTFGGDENVECVQLQCRGGSAHDAYLRGMRALNIRDLGTAAALFREAVGQESGFALAHAAYAVTLILQTRYYLVDDWEPNLTEAERQAQLAINSNPTSSKALSALALTHISRYAWDDAIRTFESIIDIYPRDAEVRLWYGELCILLNDMPAAIHQLSLSLQFDPLSPLPLRTLAYAHHCMGDAQSAEHFLRSAYAIASESGQFILQMFTITFLLAHKRLDEVEEHLRKLVWLDSVSDDDIQTTIAAIRTYHETRQPVPLPDSLLRGNIVGTILGRLLAASGNFERAVDILEPSFDKRDFWAMSVLSDPMLAEMREHEYARKFVERMQAIIPESGL